jgi:hypothetical protein
VCDAVVAGGRRHFLYELLRLFGVAILRWTGIRTGDLAEFVGVLVLAIGMRIGLIATKGSQENRIAAGAIHVNIGKIFGAYLVSLVLSAVAIAAAVRIPAYVNCFLPFAR